MREANTRRYSVTIPTSGAVGRVASIQQSLDRRGKKKSESWVTCAGPDCGGFLARGMIGLRPYAAMPVRSVWTSRFRCNPLALSQDAHTILMQRKEFAYDDRTGHGGGWSEYLCGCSRDFQQCGIEFSASGGEHIGKEIWPVAEQSHVVTVNRQAYHDYFVDETIEAGIALTGTEIKSIRAGKVNLRGAYARIKDGEVWLDGAHIAEYEPGTYMNHAPMRPRKLLLHRREIDRLTGRIQAKGFTLVPLKMYFQSNRVKVELGLCRGKKLYDKRETIKERETQRELARVTKLRAR